MGSWLGTESVHKGSGPLIVLHLDPYLGELTFPKRGPPAGDVSGEQLSRNDECGECDIWVTTSEGNPQRLGLEEPVDIDHGGGDTRGIGVIVVHEPEVQRGPQP